MKAKHPERAERLRDFLNRLNIKNITLASKLGIKPAFISQLLNKHSTVTADVALRIARVCPKLNVTWLLDGVGEMLIEKKEGDVDSLTVVMEMEPPAYERRPGEGRLEWLERKIKETEEENEQLRQEQKELLEQMNELREQHYSTGERNSREIEALREKFNNLEKRVKALEEGEENNSPDIR